MPEAVDTYGLTRDAKESSRLNGQHVVWKKNIGFLLHPSVTATIPGNARICDIGTGTGVWILDVASGQDGSNYRCEGLDLSSSQFPSRAPDNVTFSTLNVLDPVPEELKATFDVIHLRLLVLGLPQGTWHQACSNLLELLKPGGWLQWEEADFLSMRVLHNEPGASKHATQRIQHTVIQDGSKRGQGYDDVQNLASIVSSAGFDRVNTDIFSSDRISATRGDFSQTVMGALSGIIEMFKKADGGGGFWSTDEAKQIYDDAATELDSGKVYYRAELNVVYAQKA